MNNVTKLSVVLAVVLAVAGFVTVATEVSDAAAQTTVAVDSEDDFVMASDTIYQLTENVTLTNQLKVDGVANVTLDLNGNQLTISGYHIWVDGGGSLTITDSIGGGVIFTNSDFPLYVTHGTMDVLGGTVVSECPISVQPVFGLVKGSTNPSDSNYSTMTVGPGAHLKYAGDGTNPIYGVMIGNTGEVAYGTTLNINCQTTGLSCLAYVNGNIKATDGATPAVNITGGDYKLYYTVIYGAGYANYNITDGTFDCGLSGVEVRAGNLNVSGGTFVVHASPATAEPNGNGSTSGGCAISISTHTTNLPIDVKITGGSFTAYWPFQQVDVRNQTTALTVPTMSISGGTFTSTATGDSKYALFSNNCTGFITGGTFDGILKTNVTDGNCIADGYVRVGNTIGAPSSETVSSGNSSVSAESDTNTVVVVVTDKVSNATVGATVNVSGTASETSKVEMSYNGSLTTDGIAMSATVVAPEEVPVENIGNPVTVYDLVVDRGDNKSSYTLTVTVTLDIPAGMTLSGAYVMFYEDGKDPERYTPEVDGATVTFTTTHNTYYAVYGDVVEAGSGSQPSWDDDEDLPPFIPTQPAEDDDTVTIVACAAAAAVAAIMAVFLIIDRKG